MEYELGCADDEINMNLENAMCPGFISDDLRRVIWTNVSYKKLIFGKEEDCSKLDECVACDEREAFFNATDVHL